MGLLWRVVLATALVLGGGFAAYQGGKLIANGFKSRGYAATQGRVVQSRVDSERVTGTSGGKRRTTTEYRATIRYEYTVAGATYTGDRLTVERTGYSGKDRGAAERSAAAYPTGTAVTVYYDPRHPATAVLKPGLAGPAAWLLFAAGPAMLVAAGWLLLRLRRRPTPVSAAPVPYRPSAAELEFR